VIEGLSGPTAIAFNPDTPTQLWVTNRTNDSLAIVDTAGQTPPEPLRIRDRSAHFLIYPSSLAFSSDQTIGTCQESENDYRGRATANNFMGPVISPTDLDAIRTSPTNTHYDMLHHSPLCMGIANVAPREFWVFNGQAGSIDKYIFHEWHMPGGDDHADGQTWRFAAGELTRVATVPSHMAFDAMSGMLYVADTGNARVVRLDTRVETTTSMPRVRTRITETPLYSVPDSRVEEVVGAAGELQQPSGLALRNGLLYVGDYANGRISAFRPSGERVNWLDTGLGENTLTGIAFGPEGRLFAVDRTNNRVVRIDPR
jgi:DNA-binding beta-propeller fold protein YncE